MNPRILFYVQHLLGIGHVKRAAAIARAMSDAGMDVTVVSGGPPVPLADFGGAAVRQLPAARAADSSFKILLDDEDQPITDAWRQNRRTVLQEIYTELQPDLVLIELFPFGRRQFRFELLPLLKGIGKRIPVVCSVRDVLVGRRKPERDTETTEIILRYFDHVLVHGDEQLIAFDETFPAAARFQDRISYTGYVTDDGATRVPTPAGTGEVIVSTGSGAVGEKLLRVALQARPLGNASHLPWRLLTGDYLSNTAFEAIRTGVPENVSVERSRPEFRDMLFNAALSVSLGGYNTVMDVLCAHCPAVIVPFADSGEGEQTYRARVFARHGWIHLLEPGALSAATLSAVMDAALAAGRPEAIDIDMTGAATTARLIRDMV